jgi:hypothetical protein
MIKNDSLAQKKCRDALPRAEYYLWMRRDFGRIADPVNQTGREKPAIGAGQEFAARLPVSTSVNLVDGTPAFKSPSR